MSNLFAFGCSLTYGQSLSDCWTNKKIPYGPVPSKQAWPQLLADKLNLNCINLSAPGASNKQILNQIDEVVDKISVNDVVFVKWTFHDRWGVKDLAHKKQWRQIVRPHVEWYKWIKMFFTNEDAYWINSILIDYTSYLFKERNIKHYYLYTDKELPSMLKCKISRFVKDGSINLIRYDYPPALDDSHPGQEAHKVFAETIYKNIKDLKNETTL
jgi:lysophospholipase L1-like esterase